MVRYGTLRSDYLPQAKKVSAITYNARVRGRLRTSRMRSAAPVGNVRTLRNRASKPSAAGRGGRRMKVTVPNLRSGQRGRRGRSTGEPVYQFKKYLEAMKESGTVAKPELKTIAVAVASPVAKQSVTEAVKRPGLSRVVAKSTRTSHDKLPETEDNSQSGDDTRMEEDEHTLVEDGSERRVKLVKTTVVTGVKTPKRPEKLYNVSGRSNSRMVKGHQTKDDENATPSARLFWKSFS